jgi:hypothetical protein
MIQRSKVADRFVKWNLRRDSNFRVYEGLYHNEILGALGVRATL